MGMRYGTALATAGLVAASLFGLSWTTQGPSIEFGVPLPAVDPISPHQKLSVEGVAYVRPISDWSNIPTVPLELIDEETVWLARCIFSETKDAREMELVAWVVRNRVETGYRGKNTYKSTVLDPFQFSAFNDESTTRDFYASLQKHHDFLGWQEALRIAYLVRTDDGRRRPFSEATRHFYSEVSMVGRTSPVWSSGYEPVVTPGDFEVDERRFRFYEDIS